MICLALPQTQAISIKEKATIKTETKTHKPRYVGDSMLMQASEPTHMIHQKDASTQLAQITASSDKSQYKIIGYEVDTGMVVLIVILTIIIVVVLICCCCWCCACCIFAAAEAEREKQEKEKKEKEDKEKKMDMEKMDMM